MGTRLEMPDCERDVQFTDAAEAIKQVKNLKNGKAMSVNEIK